MNKETEKQILKNFRKQTRMNTQSNLRRNSTVGEQMQMELRRKSVQLRRGSRAEVSSDMWEKLQSINLNTLNTLNKDQMQNSNNVSTRPSGITLAVEQVPEENENEGEENNNNDKNDDDILHNNYDSSRTNGGYVIGLIQNSDSVDDNKPNSEENNNNNNHNKPNKRSSILKPTASNM